MSELNKIKSVDPETARWLSGMKTKYSIEDLRAGQGTPLEEDLLGWSNEVAGTMKRNIRKTRSEATKALMQSIVALPVFSRANSLVSQIRGESYAELLQHGVSGTKVKRDTPFKFKNNFVGTKMVASFQVYIAAKPIRLNPKRGQTKKALNKQVAFAMAKSVKMKGIKPRSIYGDIIKENSRELQELRNIVGRNLGGAFAASIVAEFS